MAKCESRHTVHLDVASLNLISYTLSFSNLRKRPQWKNVFTFSRWLTLYVCVSLKSMASDHGSFDVLRCDTVEKDVRKEWKNWHTVRHIIKMMRNVRCKDGFIAFLMVYGYRLLYVLIHNA